MLVVPFGFALSDELAQATDKAALTGGRRLTPLLGRFLPSALVGNEQAARF
jgi:hypothetical protein